MSRYGSSTTERLGLTDCQAYYRRAVANTAILNSREALKDFKTVVKKVPNDKDAKLKLADCEKIIRHAEFLKAIEVGDPPLASAGLDIEAIAVDKGYDGVRLEKEMTQEFIDDMIQRFKNGKKIHRRYVFQIIMAVKDIVYQEATMVEMEIEKGSKLTVCGDTHGMYRKGTAWLG
jgi:serine/threonine-protein phosphatase 5